jgi:predicted metalloenzyme YecM
MLRLIPQDSHIALGTAINRTAQDSHIALGTAINRTAQDSHIALGTVVNGTAQDSHIALGTVIGGTVAGAVVNGRRVCDLHLAQPPAVVIALQVLERVLVVQGHRSRPTSPLILVYSHSAGHC